MERRDKVNYYLDLAEVVSQRATCLRRQYGAVIVKNANPCSMGKRMIVNAGIEMVYIRDDKDNYRVIKVQDYIDNDESLSGQMGY